MVELHERPLISDDDFQRGALPAARVVDYRVAVGHGAQATGVELELHFGSFLPVRYLPATRVG